MTEESRESNSNDNIDDLLDGLSKEERILVILREELYEGSWKLMEDDLQNRLDDKPYVFKLVNQIEDDLERIENLKELEEDHDINLADYVDKLENEE